MNLALTIITVIYMGAIYGVLSSAFKAVFLDDEVNFLARWVNSQTTPESSFAATILASIMWPLGLLYGILCLLYGILWGLWRGPRLVGRGLVFFGRGVWGLFPKRETKVKLPEMRML